MASDVNEETFICLGMTKERWPELTPETIRHLLDNPEELDYDDEGFVECFFFYHGWYWSNNA